MQPSPIQLREMHYLGIKIWPTPIEIENDQASLPFDFNGVMIGERIEVIILDVEDNPDNPVMYGVKLHITIDNKKGKIAPYTLDVGVAGIFETSEKIPKEQRNDLITVNGCAVLYSAIRDQIMTISARCSNGVFILPTVNFQDRIKKETGSPQGINKGKLPTTRPARHATS